MGKSRFQRRVTACIAAWAMLWLALAPSISHAVRSMTMSPESPWLVTCSTAHRAATAPTNPGQAPADSDALAHALAHCPCCVSPAVDLGPPPALASLSPAPAVRQDRPRLAAISPAEGISWRTGNPRGPPATT